LPPKAAPADHTVTPALKPSSRQRSGESELDPARFEASVGGRIVVASSRQPLLDAARALIAEVPALDVGGEPVPRLLGEVAACRTEADAAEHFAREVEVGRRRVPFDFASGLATGIARGARG
jgi:hypothetical protein